MKIIENNSYEEKERLIKIEDNKYLDGCSEKHIVWLSLSSKNSPSILSSKRCLYFQLSIVCVLLFFCLCCVVIIFGELSDSSKQVNILIDRFTDTDTTDDSNNQTEDFVDNQFLKTKIRHGSVRVTTHCGTIFGSKEYESYVFKGIPYAHPPTGQRRWTPPELLCNPYSHRHCNKFGSHCFQVNPISGVLEGKEDCLYLNIWTPSIDPEANLPVMIWIHGGFLQFGSGHQPGLKPNGKLAQKTNTVYISLNYRLHAFGFLGLDFLGNNTKQSTNFGLMDVILALHWIQHNIKSFGGHNRRITLFGADSGAALILAIMTNPGYRHLYQSSWLIDPAVYFDRPLDRASKDNKKYFLKRTNCKSIDCLRSMTAQDIVQAFIGKNDPSFRIIDQNDLPILGIFNEQLITTDNTIVLDSYPFEKISSDIPVLIGSSSQAIASWPGPRDLDSWKWNDYVKYVTTSMDSFGPRLSQKSLELYKPWHLYFGRDYEPLTPQLQYVNMVSDLRQVCPINYLSEILAINGYNENVYRYIISTRMSKPVRVYEYPVNYSFHLMDIISFFGQLDVWIRWPTFNDYSISETMQQIVMSFINRNNNTELLQSFHWQSFPKQMAEIVSQLNYTSIVTSNYRPTDRCYFWRSEQFFNYMWTV